MTGQKSVCHCPWQEQKGRVTSCEQTQGVALELIREHCLSKQPSSVGQESYMPVWCHPFLSQDFSNTVTPEPLLIYLSVCPLSPDISLKVKNPSPLHSSTNFFHPSLQIIIMEIVFNEFFFLIHFSYIFPFPFTANCHYSCSYRLKPPRCFMSMTVWVRDSSGLYCWQFT